MSVYLVTDLGEYKVSGHQTIEKLAQDWNGIQSEDGLFIMCDNYKALVPLREVKLIQERDDDD